MTFASETAYEQLMLSYEKVERIMAVLAQVEAVQVAAFLVNQSVLRQVHTQVV